MTLPHHDIVPVHRADGSGDTFVFTQYLSFTTEADAPTGFFTAPNSWSKSPGFGTTIKWPQLADAQTAVGNQGIVDLLSKTPYGIGYIGVSFGANAKAAKLGTAMMRSYSGQFLLPTVATVTAAAASLTPRTPADERLSLINALGENCYPLINYEYAMVQVKQKDSATANALRHFLLWATVPDETNEKTLAAYDSSHYHRPSGRRRTTRSSASSNNHHEPAGSDQVLPRRRVVERTAGWLKRKLARDSGRLNVSDASRHRNMGAILLRRAARSKS